jgi:hypothetical protein
VVGAEDSDIDVDATIKFTVDWKRLENDYEIQVGHGYLMLNKYEGSGDDFGVRTIAESKNIKDLIPKIKKELGL